MSKKQIHSRLETFFSTLAEDGSLPRQPDDQGANEASLPPETPTGGTGAVTSFRNGWGWEIDSSLRYTACGPEVHTMLGIDAQFFLGKDFLTSGLQPGSHERLAAALQAETFPVEVDVIFEHPQNGPVPVRVHMLSRTTKQGRPAGWLGFARRISANPALVPQKEPAQNSTAASDRSKYRSPALSTVETAFPARPTEPVKRNGSPGPATASRTAAGDKGLASEKIELVNASDQNPAAITLPIQMQGVGDLLLEIVDESAGREWSEDDRILVTEVAAQLAAALEKQRLFEQAQRRALELQTASEIARDTASTLSLDLLLSRIVQMLSERFGFYHTAIFLLDESGLHAVVREATGAAGEEMKQRGYRIRVGSPTVLGQVTANGEPAILNDVQNNSAYLSHPLLQHTRSEMSIPLKIGSTVIGALDLHSKEMNAFTQDDVTVLQILADQIAIAIENARAYELSQKAIDEMKEVDRVKSQFLANMSHELRTPLNSIIGFSRVILKGIDGPVNDVQTQDLNAIYHSGQHLLSLITDILDLSKIEAGKMELVFAETNIADLINSGMSTAVGLVKDKSIKLQTVIPDDLPAVRADTTRVRQVLINFLSNAAKFTEQGSITVEASLVTGPDLRREVMITVADTGPGIAEQDRAKLFLPFSQVDDSPTRKTGGTGLGLSICRSLIELHGGRIGLLKSEIGRGSTFFFTLPLMDLEAVETPPSIPRAGNIILAIDDDPRVIALYERYLTPHGYQVVSLTDPKQALARAKEIQPLAITLDIMMPGKDGWQVLREIKTESSTRDIPIIICSIMEDQEKGFSMGAADYLVKPFLQEDMINALNRINQDGGIKEVLVIDDDPADLRLVQKMLEDNPNYHITTAEGGSQGWLMLQTAPPDVVILDLFMPDMNGFHILENMRTTQGLQHIPVIILTGADLTPEHLQQITEFGQGVMAKGYLQENDLLNVLEDALRKLRPMEKTSK